MNYEFNKNFLIGFELVKRKLITQEQLDEGLIMQQRKNVRIGKVLMDLGYISEDDLVRVIADQLSVRYIDFTSLEVTPELLKKAPLELVKSCNIFPVAFTDDSVTFCVSDPLDPQLKETLEKHTTTKVKLAIASRYEIRVAINKHYGG
ncbi:MAG: hypothetical protein KKH94_13075 [Candidatus Omnitrophica bacterium]|nr:hypothetical protein [Candidatus Omnitrophota bacterium]